MSGLQHALLVAARDEHQRAVELVHLVEEDRHVHGARLRHLVVVDPGAVILVPLPDVAVEGRLAVDLELVHVHVLAEQLLDRLDHAGMARELGERVAVQVRGEIGAHHVSRLLAHVLGAPLRVERRHLVVQDLDLLRREQAREEKIAVAVELLQLPRRQFHGLRSIWKKISSCLTIPSSERARSSIASVPCLRSRTSAVSVALRPSSWRFLALSTSSLLSRRHAVSQPPLPSQSGYWMSTISAPRMPASSLISGARTPPGRGRRPSRRGPPRCAAAGCTSRRARSATATRS